MKGRGGSSNGNGACDYQIDQGTWERKRRTVWSIHLPGLMNGYDNGKLQLRKDVRISASLDTLFILFFNDIIECNVDLSTTMLTRLLG
jgi:hypothetical protein